MSDIENGLKRNIVRDQLELLRFRNTCSAFQGELSVLESEVNEMQLRWSNEICSATLKADLESFEFEVVHAVSTGEEKRFFYNQKEGINEDLSH